MKVSPMQMISSIVALPEHSAASLASFQQVQQRDLVTVCQTATRHQGTNGPSGVQLSKAQKEMVFYDFSLNKSDKKVYIILLFDYGITEN